MNILIVSHKFWPSAGGTQTLSLGFAKELVRRGNSVTVFTSVIKTGRNEEWYNGIHIVRFRRWNLPINRPWYFTPGMLPASIGGPSFDLVHAFHFVTFQSLLASIIHKTLHIPFVLTASYHPWNGFYERVVGRGVMQNADALIAQCEQERESILPLCAGKNVFLVPCGIDSGAILRARTSDDFRSEMGISRDEKVILYVGSLGGRKSVSDLIQIMPEVLKKVPEARLLLVGGGSETQELSHHARALGVEKAVKIAGRLSGEETLSAYRASDVFALPSKHESFGIVLIEAAGSALPIVTTRVGVAPELVMDGVTGFLASACDSSFADKLCRVLSDSAFRENARLRQTEILTKYDWATVTSTLLAVYDRVLASGSEEPSRRPHQRAH